jgi:hypothetical protein
MYLLHDQNRLLTRRDITATNCSFNAVSILQMLVAKSLLFYRSSKSLASDQHKEEILKRFMLYSLYAWGVPLVPTALSLIFYHIKVLPSAIQLVVDNDQCLMCKDTFY